MYMNVYVHAKITICLTIRLCDYVITYVRIITRQNAYISYVLHTYIRNTETLTNCNYVASN